MTTGNEPSAANSARDRRDNRQSANQNRRTKQPQAGTKPANTAGGLLERRIARVEFAEGALVRLRVPVPAEDADSGRDVLTDIDVLSVEVGSRLQIELATHECKSGRGQSGEPYTIVWLAGFRQLLKLSRVSIARQTISNRGRALARRLNIIAVDETTLAKREAGHAWVPDRFAHVDGEACADAEARTDAQLRGLPAISSELATFLRSQALMADSAAIIAALSELGTSTHQQGVLPSPTSQVLAGHALIAIILAGLKDAARLDEIGEKELHARLQRALTLGDENDIYMLPLLERADALVRYYQNQTHKAYVAKGAEPLPIDVPSLRAAIAEAPSYLDDYLDFVVRMRANPQVARQLLQTAELVCFEALLGSNAWKESAFAHLFTPEHRSLLLVAVRSLEHIAGVSVAQPLKSISHLTFGSGAVADRHQSPTTKHTAAAGVQEELTLDSSRADGAEREN